MAATQLKLELLEAERGTWTTRLSDCDSVSISPKRKHVRELIVAKIAELDDAILNELEKVLS